MTSAEREPIIGVWVGAHSVSVPVAVALITA